MKHVEGGLKGKVEGPNKQRETLGEVVICRGFRMWPQIVSKSLQNHLKVSQNCIKNLKIISKPYQNLNQNGVRSLGIVGIPGPSLASLWSLSGASLVPLWSLVGPSLDPRRTLVGPSLVPPSVQTIVCT